MQADDFARSGRTELKRAFSKKGPLAIFNPVWESIIQPGKDPVCLFRFEPFGSDNLPESAVCSWDFGNNRIVKGRSIIWLFGGQADQKVSLNLSIGGYNSTATRFFFPKSPDPANEPPRVSVLTPEGRAQYRGVYQMMVLAVPNEKRPCEDWNETMWEGLAAVLDQETDPAFFGAMVERSLPDMKRAPRELRWKIEDWIIEVGRRTDPKKALAWVELFEKDEKDGKRIVHWKAKEIELALYELNDVGLARVYAGQLVGRHIDKHSSALGLVRMGDVERFNNNFEAARQFYTKAQELYAGSNSPAKAPTKPLIVSRKPGEQTAETNIVSPKKTGATAPIKKLPVTRLDLLAQSVSDWKVAAVQEAGYYATVQDLIAQDAYEEARATLDQWELEFPTTKLTGDYLLAEALYYIALNNYRTAVRILANYRSAVEISNELPKAMRMELYCLTKMERDKEARAFARAIIERLPRHELANEMRNLLAQNEPGPLRIDFDVHTRSWTASEKVDSSGLAKLFDTNKVAIIKVEPKEKDGYDESTGQSGKRK
jgi:TolA-binding protein